MISACVLIRAERGKFDEVAKNLKQIPEVKKAFSVLGRYDIVADFEAPDSKRLGPRYPEGQQALRGRLHRDAAGGGDVRDA